jgi:uncharacterized protein (TIGR02453 family)
VPSRYNVFSGFTQDMIDFMLEIRFNNNKEFMAAHRREYEQKMRAPHHALIEALAPHMLLIDPQMEVRPAKALSRVFRDTRFSKDKAPYRDHHWIAFRRAGEPRDQAIMFWFEVRVEGLSWGLGFWGENRPAMDMMRRRVISHPDDLLALLPSLEENDLIISGEGYKKMQTPAELPAALIPYYPLKEIYVTRQNIQRDWIFTPELLSQLVHDYQLMAPLYRLLRGYHDIAALEG